jgi:biotin carboxyl carrier protein
MTDHRPLDERSPDARQADHRAIDRLARDVLPSLADRLAATGLGELEVREGGWRIRVRRGPGATDPHASERSRPGHRSEGGRGSRQAAHGHGAGDAATMDDHPPALTSIGPGVPDPLTAALAQAPLVARSPGVGVFHAPAASLATGTKVASGDALGRVDVLGVAQEVVAPADGVVTTAFVEDGDVVEYGQPLIGLRSVREGAIAESADADGAGSAASATAAEARSAAAPASPVRGTGA